MNLEEKLKKASPSKMAKLVNKIVKEKTKEK